MKEKQMTFSIFCSHINKEVEMQAWYYDAEELDGKKFLLNQEKPIMCNQANSECINQCNTVNEFKKEFGQYPPI